MEQEQYFHTESGVQLRGVTAAQLQALYNELSSSYQLSTPQIVEAAGYSFAMVVRVALGFSANDAHVLCLCRDSIAGWVSLACARQLQNAGTTCDIIIEQDTDALSPELTTALTYFEKCNTEVTLVKEKDYSLLNSNRIQSYHVALSGLTDFLTKDFSPYSSLIEICNEYQLPVHSVIAPLGIDLESGQRMGVPLLASSTLSLGLPLAALYDGQEYAGRHYICDISVPFESCRNLTGLGEPLYSAQPVVQLFVPKPAEETEDGGDQ